MNGTGESSQGGTAGSTAPDGRATGPSGSPLVGRGDADRTAAITRSLLGLRRARGPRLRRGRARPGPHPRRFRPRPPRPEPAGRGPAGLDPDRELRGDGADDVAAAVGMARALRVLGGGPGTVWGPRLGRASTASGSSAAGVFVADPMNGFPAGTPDGPPTAVSVGGVGHIVARRGSGSSASSPGPWSSRGTTPPRAAAAWRGSPGSPACSSCWPSSASRAGPRARWSSSAFWVAVILAWTWLAVISVDLYRRTPLLTPAL